MEHQKILNLLNEASDLKFVTGKWNIANDHCKLCCKKLSYIITQSYKKYYKNRSIK